MKGLLHSILATLIALNLISAPLLTANTLPGPDSVHGHCMEAGHDAVFAGQDGNSPHHDMADCIDGFCDSSCSFSSPLFLGKPEGVNASRVSFVWRIPVSPAPGSLDRSRLIRPPRAS